MRLMSIRVIKRVIGCFLLLWSAYAATAGELAISPLRVDFDPEARMSVVQLTNTGPEKLAMQVQPVAWSQDFTGQDRYDPTREVVAFPPIFSIEPGETQMVRIGAQNVSDQDMERSYRLFFTEIPAPMAEGQPSALRMRLRISIPVFDAPVSGLNPEIEMDEAWFEEGLLKVRLRNTGNTHLRAQSMQIMAPTGMSSVGLGRYFLPGSTHEVEVDLKDTASVSAIQLTTDLLGESLFEAEGLQKPPRNLVAQEPRSATSDSLSSSAAD